MLNSDKKSLLGSIFRKETASRPQVRKNSALLPISPTVQSIIEQIKTNQKQKVIEAIAAFNEVAQSNNLIRALIAIQEPAYWLALLQNKILSLEIDQPFIHAILQKTQGLYQANWAVGLAIYPQDILDGIGPIMAATPHLARKIGYINLVMGYAFGNPSLYFFMIMDPEYIVHLDETSVLRLMNINPAMIGHLIDRMLGILANAEFASCHLWIKTALKKWLTKCEHMPPQLNWANFQRYLIANEAEAQKLIPFYVKEFQTDLNFSYAVCVTPYLSAKLNISKETILEHPLISAEEYFQLGNIYLMDKSAVSQEMAALCFEKSAKEEHPVELLNEEHSEEDDELLSILSNTIARLSIDNSVPTMPVEIVAAITQATPVPVMPSRIPRSSASSNLLALLDVDEADDVNELGASIDASIERPDAPGPTDKSLPRRRIN